MRSNLHLCICLSLVACFAACVGEDPEEQDLEAVQDLEDGQDSGSENLSSIEQGIYSGWTPYTSEEYPPIVCDSGSRMSAVQCNGSFCDNIRAYCSPSGGSVSASYWTSHVSEEGTNTRHCNGGYWVTGFACQGSYCDNIALQCSYISNTAANSCYWTGWVSEESGGYLSFGTGYFAKGIQCNGSFCDNKRFYVCRS